MPFFLTTTTKMTAVVMRGMLSVERFALTVNSIKAEHLDPSLEGDERANARVQVADLLSNCYEEYIGDDPKDDPFLLLLHDSPTKIDWIYFSQKLDGVYAEIPVDKDMVFNNYTNRFTFTLADWLSSNSSRNDDTQIKMRKLLDKFDAPLAVSLMASDLKQEFADRLRKSHISRNEFLELVCREILECIDWKDVAEDIYLSTKERTTW